MLHNAGFFYETSAPEPLTRARIAAQVANVPRGGAVYRTANLQTDSAPQLSPPEQTDPLKATLDAAMARAPETHVTKRGNTLTGYVLRAGTTEGQARKIDQSAFGPLPCAILTWRSRLQRGGQTCRRILQADYHIWRHTTLRDVAQKRMLPRAMRRLQQYRSVSSAIRSAQPA